MEPDKRCRQAPDKPQTAIKHTCCDRAQVCKGQSRTRYLAPRATVIDKMGSIWPCLRMIDIELTISTAVMAFGAHMIDGLSPYMAAADALPHGSTVACTITSRRQTQALLSCHCTAFLSAPHAASLTLSAHAKQRSPAKPDQSHCDRASPP